MAMKIKWNPQAGRDAAQHKKGYISEMIGGHGQYYITPAVNQHSQFLGFLVRFCDRNGQTSDVMELGGTQSVNVPADYAKTSAEAKERCLAHLKATYRETYTLPFDMTAVEITTNVWEWTVDGVTWRFDDDKPTNTRIVHAGTDVGIINCRNIDHAAVYSVGYRDGMKVPKNG